MTNAITTAPAATPVQPRRPLVRLHVPDWGNPYAVSPWIETGAGPRRRREPRPGLPDALAALLDRGGLEPRSHVILGAHSEPLPPGEDPALTLTVTRLLLDAGATVHLWTASPLAAGLPAMLPDVGRLRVGIILPTLSRVALAAIDPGGPEPLERLDLTSRLARASLAACLVPGPILSGVSDSPLALQSLAAAAEASGASGYVPPLRSLVPLRAEWAWPRLRALQPHLNSRYARRYRGAWPAAGYTAAVADAIEAACRDAGLVPVLRPGWPPVTSGQLSFGAPAWQQVPASSS